MVRQHKIGLLAPLVQKTIDLVPTSNQLNFVLALSEMQDDDLYDSIEKYAVQNKVAYIFA